VGGNHGYGEFEDGECGKGTVIRFFCGDRLVRSEFRRKVLLDA